MGDFTSNPLELATALTDGILAAEALVCAAILFRSPGFRARLWASSLAFLALGAALGGVVHGLELDPALHGVLWFLVDFLLGLTIALIVVAGLEDGWNIGRRGLWPMMAVGAAFPWVATALGGSFGLFLIYEGAGMAFVLVVYLRLAATRTLPGAATIALAICVNFLAGAVQASSLQVRWIWVLDHNSAFHLIQMLGVALLTLGVRRGFIRPQIETAPGGAMF